METTMDTTPTPTPGLYAGILPMHLYPEWFAQAITEPGPYWWGDQSRVLVELYDRSPAVRAELLAALPAWAEVPYRELIARRASLPRGGASWDEGLVIAAAALGGWRQSSWRHEPGAYDARAWCNARARAVAGVIVAWLALDCIRPYRAHALVT